MGTTEVGNSTELRNGKIGSASSFPCKRKLSGPDIVLSLIQALTLSHTPKREPSHSGQRSFSSFHEPPSRTNSTVPRFP